MKDLTGLERLVEKLIDNKDRPLQTFELYIGKESLKDYLCPDQTANEKVIRDLVESNANLNKRVEYLETLMLVLAQYIDQLDREIPNLDYRAVELNTFLRQANEIGKE